MTRKCASLAGGATSYGEDELVPAVRSAQLSFPSHPSSPGDAGYRQSINPTRSLSEPGRPASVSRGSDDS
eukprot:751697-Hanusia_phi.AAC.1